MIFPTMEIYASKSIIAPSFFLKLFPGVPGVAYHLASLPLAFSNFSLDLFYHLWHGSF
jgi:hypothetical protein